MLHSSISNFLSWSRAARWWSDVRPKHVAAKCSYRKYVINIQWICCVHGNNTYYKYEVYLKFDSLARQKLCKELVKNTKDWKLKYSCEASILSIRFILWRTYDRFKLYGSVLMLDISVCKYHNTLRNTIWKKRVYISLTKLYVAAY
jgi:hypothetical protein